MAELDEKTIKTLTELSRIHCTDEERVSLLDNLKKILVYMEQLKEIDTEGVEPCNHVLEDFMNVTREDEIGETLSREAFLANAPQHVGGLIRVPTVIKQNR